MLGARRFRRTVRAAKTWYAVQVPTTVTAALVKQKVYPDPEFGMNLRSSQA